MRRFWLSYPEPNQGVQPTAYSVRSSVASGRCFRAVDAMSEAAVLFLRHHLVGQKYLTRLEKKHGKGKAFTIFAHQ